MRSLFAATLVTTLMPFVAFAQMESADCLMCHEDPALVKETEDGREVSVHVDADGFASSVHGVLDCTDCHGDIEDYPHESVAPVECSMCHPDEEGSTARGVHSNERRGRAAASCADCHGNHGIRPPTDRGSVNCAACHGRVATEQRRSLHGQAAARGDELAPTCAYCHGGHEILRHTNPKSATAVMNIPLLCGQCHREGSEVSEFRDIPQEQILEHYVDSIHGEGLYKKGLIVTAVCTSCHNSHDILPHTDPRSSISKDNIAGTCTQCHAQIEEVHRRVIDGRLWETEPHRIPPCVDCHPPHDVRQVFYDLGTANRDCLRCHEKPDLSMERDGETVSLYVDARAYAASMHSTTACAQCHTEVDPTHERPCEAIRNPVDCVVCHPDQVEAYRESTHGQLAAKNDPDAPGCLDCHSNHATKSKRLPTSPTFARNVPELCARCHRPGERAANRIESMLPNPVGTYADSIHGRGLTESGLVVTATCVNCHSSHRELPPDDPRSSVHRDNLAGTCGTCHNGIEEAFESSIHATGEPKDGKTLPTCNDCHTSHAIGRHDVPGFRTQMMEQCGRCHEDEAETFFDTFHGKVSLLGTEGAAKCSDCHGKHAILPPDDTRSTLSRSNVVETCGQCHESSHRRFAGYLTHATHHDPHKWPWLYWSFRFMVALLVGTLSFFLIHTAFWLVRLWRTRELWTHHKASDRDGKKQYGRFTRVQRIQHLVMLMSFFVLALTGMALKFSYMSWAQGIAWLLGGGESMGVIHRMGAVVLILVFTVHLINLARYKRREKLSIIQMLSGPNTLMFTVKDVRELWQSFRWFLGKGPRPHYGRYTYWEKFDYFAVFWGMIVIGFSGLMLWFPELLTRILPGWSINVATIVHSDEALLAVAFIFTIHFFNTHFRPDKFPMDPVIFTGRVPLDELQYDKPGEYEALVESGRLEEHLVDPIPPEIEKAFRIFGFFALGVGLTLVVLILWAMIFAYR